MRNLLFEEIKVGEKFQYAGSPETFKKISDWQAEILADARHSTVHLQTFYSNQETTTPVSDPKELQIIDQIEQGFGKVELINAAMEAAVYSLAEHYSEHCKEIIAGLLRMIISVQSELDDLVEQSHRTKVLEKLIDDKLFSIGDSESDTFKKIRDTRPDLFDKINLMVMDALDNLEFDPDQYAVKYYDHSKLSSPMGDRFLAMLGLVLTFVGEKLVGIQVFQDCGPGTARDLAYTIHLQEDGSAAITYNETQQLSAMEDKPEPKSAFPVFAAAAALTAAAVIKFQSKKEKVQQSQGVQNAR